MNTAELQSLIDLAWDNRASLDPTNAPAGALSFRGDIPPGHGAGAVTIATIRFKVLGAAGRTTTTQTTLGPLLGTDVTGGFNYRAKTHVQEGTLTVP